MGEALPIRLLQLVTVIIALVVSSCRSSLLLSSGLLVPTGFFRSDRYSDTAKTRKDSTKRMDRVSREGEQGKRVPKAAFPIGQCRKVCV